MQGNTAFAGTADAASPATVQQCATPVEKYTDEQVRQFVIALEDPFDPREIKWRVTNTTSDRRRGQVIAYADPRAYTDRLNALFTVRGWTREYTVQVIQNFERKERGNGDGILSGKIVVTCRVTIAGMGSHSGLGEEWADNENAGTSAEAQAFKRACSCFGLGRISTISVVIGLIWTSGSSRSPGHGYPIGLSQSGSQSQLDIKTGTAIRTATGT
jgi:hypothetical protein